MGENTNYKDIPLYIMGLFNIMINKDSKKGNQLLEKFIEDRKNIVEVYNSNNNLETYTVNIENLYTSYIRILSKSNLNI